MATTTPNLGLTKPEVADRVNVSDLNENADLLDAIIGKLSDLNTAQKDSLVAAINEALTSAGTAAGNGLTSAQVKALDGMFKVCAFIKDDVSAEYTAFKTAFGIADSGVTSFTPTWTENTTIIVAGSVVTGSIVSYDGWYLSHEIDCGNYNTLRFKTEHTSWFSTPNVWGNTASGSETGFENLAGNSDNNANYMGGNYSKEVWFDVSGYEYVRISTNIKGVYNNDGQVVYELEV